MFEHPELMLLAKRVVAHLEAKSTDQADEVMRVPVSAYADPQRWSEEMDGIFRKVPLVLGLTAELPGPGTYKAIELLGTPVLVVRSGDGVVRAFLNVCRHRGAALVDAGCGAARGFRCPYHAWSYDDHGALIGIYGESTFGDVDRATHGLTVLPCAERAGFIFGSLTPGVTPRSLGTRPTNSTEANSTGGWLDDWLGDYGPELDRLGLDRWHLTGRRELEGAGWKVCYDGYLEGYHFQSLHRTTIFTQTMSNLMVSDAYGPHQRVVFAKHSASEMLGVPETEWKPADHIGPIYTIFPHVSVAGAWGSQCMISQLIPGPTHDRSRTIQYFLSRDPLDTDEARAKAEAHADFLYQVVRDEDYKTGLDIQRGVGSGANTHFVFGRNEVTLQRFHQWVERLMSEADEVSM